MNVLDILITEDILLGKKCVICYNNFINIKDANYQSFLEKIKVKYTLSETDAINFEDETTCLCYDDDGRFECLTCKNIVCSSCIDLIPDNENGKVEDGYAMFNNGYTQVVYKTLSMRETGIIVCPICRTKDTRKI